LNAANSSKALNAQLCKPYLTYISTLNQTLKQEMLQVLESPNLSAGYGTYFAEDPLTSHSYGNYLVEVIVPQNTKCIKFEFSNPTFMEFFDPGYYATQLTPYVLSDEGILLYPWASAALVVRDFSALYPLNFRVTKFVYPTNVVEIYKLPPIFDEVVIFEDWQKLHQYYGLWISKASGWTQMFSDDYKIYEMFSKSEIIELAIASAINFEFSSNTPDFKRAKKDLSVSLALNISVDDSKKILIELSSNLNISTTTDLLIRANYLPESAMFSNSSLIVDSMFKLFAQKNGTRNLMKMIDAYLSIRDQVPRISTWKYTFSSIQ
jgi:hypothetical protein